jgi:hypothetical protein
MIRRWAKTRWSTIDKSRLRQSDGVECMGRKYRTAHSRGLARSRRARWKHGLYSAEALAEQKRVRDLLAQSRELLKQMQAG